MILFWHETGKYGCFSNWYRTWFVIDSTPYISSEQYMMSQKALLFKDTEIMNEILHSTDQKTIKALGRKVRNFDPEVWDQHKSIIMHDGIYAKFTQNNDLKRILLSTGKQTIAEASPWDKIWGIGMYASNPDAKDPSKWKGQNLLGKALMQVRDEIQAEEDAKMPDEPVKEEKPVKKRFNVSKIKPGTKVIHKTFGKGTVVEKTADKHLIINFENAGKKTFALSAFDNGFLNLDESD